MTSALRSGAEEINASWRMTFADVCMWDGYDDSLLRAIMPSRCRGDIYSRLKKVIADAYPMEMCDNHIDDLVVYVFIHAVMEHELDLDVDAICQTEKKGKVSLLIDSCCFDPRCPGGDEVCLDIHAISNCTRMVSLVFPHSMRLEFRGKFEHIDSDDEGEEEEEEEGEDDSDDGFIVPDDVVVEDNTDCSSEEEDEDELEDDMDEKKKKPPQKKSRKL